MLVILVLGMGGIIVWTTFLLMSKATKPKCATKEQCIEYVRKHNLYGEYDTLEKEEILISSFDGYELHGYYHPCRDSKRYVIITHGITDSCFGSIRYVNIYHQLGFHVITYDLRNHGRNVKTYTSMGVRESKDLRAVIAFARMRFGEEIVLGLHGESLGTATSVLALRDDLKLAFCVADCGYSDMIKLMNYLVKKVYHVPGFFVALGNKLVKLCYGYSFDEISPEDNLKNNHTPILFVHGSEDAYIPSWMSEEMFELNPGYKKIEIFEGAAHAQSLASNPAKYLEMLRQFLGELLIV